MNWQEEFLQELQNIINNGKLTWQTFTELCNKYSITPRQIAMKFKSGKDEFSYKLRHMIQTSIGEDTYMKLHALGKLTLKTAIIFITQNIKEIPKCIVCKTNYVIPKDNKQLVFSINDILTYEAYIESKETNKLRELYQLKPVICDKCLRHNSTGKKIKRLYQIAGLIINHGVTNPNELEETREKIRQYRLENKDIENEKRKKTFLERYGVDNPMKHKEIRQKWEQIVKSEEFKEKISKAQVKRWEKTTEKTKQAIYSKVLQSKQEMLFSLAKQTLKEKYNVEIVIPNNAKDYVNRQSIKQVKCLSCDLIFNVTPHSTYKCPKCDISYRSTYEDEIYEYLKTNNITNIHLNDKSVCSPYEIDIYLPDYNIGIEFNGSYWHSDIFKDKDYHQKKALKCLDNKLRLIQIFEYEYLKHKDKILTWLLTNLDKNKQLIPTRKAEITEITLNEYKQFLDKYHLQGYTPTTLKLGMIYNNELISVIGLSKNRFAKDKDSTWEIVRLATKHDVYIPNAIDKYMSYITKTYDYINTVISFVDLCKFTGYNFDNSKYFELAYITNPNYVYVDVRKKDIVLTRYQTQKHKLHKLLGDKFDNSLSEYENMTNAGFVRIFDCGNKVYIWRR